LSVDLETIVARVKAKHAPLVREAPEERSEAIAVIRGRPVSGLPLAEGHLERCASIGEVMQRLSLPEAAEDPDAEIRNYELEETGSRAKGHEAGRNRLGMETDVVFELAHRRHEALSGALCESRSLCGSLGFQAEELPCVARKLLLAKVEEVMRVSTGHNFASRACRAKYVVSVAL